MKGSNFGDVMKEEMQVQEACARFGIQGKYKSFEIINSGHINTTYQVTFFRDGQDKRYILQRVNTYVFEKPVEVMENIIAVTQYIRQKVKEKQATAKRNVLHYSQATDGRYYTYMEDGSFWRCYRYIDDSVCYMQVDDLSVVEEAGVAFGEFQLYLADFPVSNLNIVIPHFHNTMQRYATFKASVERDAVGRAKGIEDEIAGYLAFEEQATQLYRLQSQGKLPLRVTHNDTKISNVLFDKDTHKHLSVIDLDTVMPGLIATDFGDAIRILASRTDEDEKDLEKVGINLEKYKAFTKGFVNTLKMRMTDTEKQTLALGAFTMTAECGMRFLTDYLDGDKYFRVHYPTQNLDRARCHLKLANDMLEHFDVMQKIVNEYLD